MFTVLHCNPSHAEPLSVERYKKPSFSNPGVPHSACDNCRAKKLKCTGEKSSCVRCQTRSIPCTYLTATEKENKEPKRRKPSQPSKRSTTSSSYSASTTSRPASRLGEGGRTPTKGPGMNNARSPHAVEEKGLLMSENIENMISIPDTDFMSLYEDTTGDPQLMDQEDRVSLRPLSFDEADDFCSSSFQPDSSSVDPMLEGLLGFESGIDFLDNWDGTDIPADNSPGSYTDQACADSCFSITIPPTTQSPLPSPADSNTGTYTRTRSVVQDSHRMHSASDRSPRADRFNSRASTYGGNNRAAAAPMSTCQCMQSALRILEDLEVKNRRVKLDAADHVVNFLKRALQQCTVMLNCRTCIHHSDFMMFLVIICQKLVNSFQRLSETTTCSMQQKQWRSSPTPPSSSSSSSLDDQRNNYSLGEYEVDSLDEVTCLMSRLVLLQLKRLEAILKRLKTLSAQRNWETHLAMLDPLDQQFQDTVSRLRRIEYQAMNYEYNRPALDRTASY